MKEFEAYRALEAHGVTAAVGVAQHMVALRPPVTAGDVRKRFELCPQA